jgi:hypothetical protein
MKREMRLMGMWLAGCVLMAGCATERAQRRPYLVQENLDNAKRHLAQQRTEEAAQIYQVVLLAEPGQAEAKAGLASIPQYDDSILRPGLLGKNLCRRPRRDGVGLWIALYPVNRVLDVMDVVSFHVGLEGGVLADVHATRAMQAGAGAGGGMQVGWWHRRNLAVGSAHAAGFELGPFNVEGEGFTRAGTGGAATRSYSVVGMSRPTDYVYQRYRDYWGVGGRVIALIVGTEVELHPVEVADALGGFFFIDFLRDDLGRTRGLDLTSADQEAMEDLLNSLSPSEMRARLRGRTTPSRVAPPMTDSASEGTQP